ncbi:MAG: hypothetical protein D6795_18165, partial [Deltaproteobacteria bacterium]
MSILGKRGQPGSLTKGRRALQLFTNRHRVVRHFAGYLQAGQPRPRILFFHGDGGNGKTLLLEYLRTNFCKYLPPDRWEEIEKLTGRTFVAALRACEAGEALPAALLDFGMPPRGEERPLEAFSALRMLRRQLARHRFPFTVFDFASLSYLHRTVGLTPERLQSLFPPEESDFIHELAGIFLGGTGVVKAFLSLCDKHLKLSEKFTLYWKRRNVSPALVREIEEMDPEKELLSELPRLFAEDLNVAIRMSGPPSRIVLFFDTHEAFWGDRRDRSEALFFERDEWLRVLLSSLDLEEGIVVVVAGREPPRWPDAPEYPIPAEYLDLHLVGHLTDEDAEEFLERAGVQEALRPALVAHTSVAPGQVHPFYLGLAADVVRAAREQGEDLHPEDFPRRAGDIGKRLVNRLLRYVGREVEDAVYALSACRSFTREQHRVLGEALGFHATNAAFRTLVSFSFVWEIPGGEGERYRIHDLLRRLLRQGGDERLRRADEALMEYYRERAEQGDGPAAAEEVYHLSRLDGTQGVARWIYHFEKASKRSDLACCRALLDIRGDLVIESTTHRGLISLCEGEFFHLVGRDREAEEEYREAVEVYDTLLAKAPDDLSLLNDKAIALIGLGKGQQALSQYEAAENSYREAIAAYDAILSLAPDDLSALNNKGLALEHLGEVQQALSRYEEAEKSYREAIAACEATLTEAPDDLSLLNDKANALQSLGTLQEDLARYEAAEKSYRAAIAAYDTMLSLAPDDLPALNNKAIALESLGELQQTLSRYEAAEKSYRAAIAAYDTVLSLAPSNISVISNRANALESLGALQQALSRYEAAENSYR